jgi:hypothetical protein
LAELAGTDGAGSYLGAADDLLEAPLRRAAAVLAEEAT